MTTWLAEKAVYRQDAGALHITRWSSGERAEMAEGVDNLLVASADEIAVHVRGPTIIVETLVDRPLEVECDGEADDAGTVSVLSSQRLTYDDPRGSKAADSKPGDELP
jgi:hypothetical protein